MKNNFIFTFHLAIPSSNKYQDFPLESNIFLLIFIFEFSIVLYKTNRWTNPL